MLLAHLPDRHGLAIPCLKHRQLHTLMCNLTSFQARLLRTRLGGVLSLDPVGRETNTMMHHISRLVEGHKRCVRPTKRIFLSLSLFLHSVYAVGVTEEDMNKPQIGIVPIWWEGNPCNSHLLDLAREVKGGCNSEGLVGLTFNTIG